MRRLECEEDVLESLQRNRNTALQLLSMIQKKCSSDILIAINEKNKFMCPSMSNPDKWFWQWTLMAFAPELMHSSCRQDDGDEAKLIHEASKHGRMEVVEYLVGQGLSLWGLSY